MTEAVNLIDASFAFSDCISLENVILPNEMILLQSTENMFANCSSLTSINLGFLRGASNLENCVGMFKSCSNLIEIDLPNINIRENVKINLSNMFRGCVNLIIANFEGVKANHIWLMNSMFNGCKNLTYLNIYNLDTRSVISCFNIFKGIEKKVEVDYDPGKTGQSLEEEIQKIIQQ